MADNFLYVPFVNPVRFYETTRADVSKYFTRHFDEWMFTERFLDWQQPEDFAQIWQVDDIIVLQFESTFDPILVKLLDSGGNPVITLPALIGLPNAYYPSTFSFEVAMSLAGLTTGCYYLQVELGSAGPDQKILISTRQFISSEPIRNSIILEYWNSKFHEDVMFETGVKFQYRMFGHFGFLDPGKKDEFYRDQRYNPALLNSRTLRVFPLYFGDEYGIPDDAIDLLNRIWSCDNVLVDNKPFGAAESSKFEFTEIDSAYPKRGVKLNVEEGINRNSRVFAITTDTTKKLITTIIVEAKVFGDTSNQGSTNTVPVTNIE